MKQCGRCKESKQLECFNKSKYSKTGYRSQCKECMKKERERLSLHYKEWRQSPEKKAWYAEYRKKRYEADKLKVKARNAARALERLPCEVCGISNGIEAHHDDYSKPLDVRWLCVAHHKEWHSKNGEALNA